MQKFFITGTDTEIGKTTITQAWLAREASAGLRTLGLKPLASGAIEQGGGLRNEDALALQAASSVSCDYALHNPYCFAQAIAPHIAAANTGITLSAAQVAAACQPGLQQDCDLILIEGVGGWACPLNTHETMADVVQLLELPVIMVVGLRLGCLNHALLTHQAIQAAGCEFAGWIANHIDPHMQAVTENLQLLEAAMGQAPLRVVPYACHSEREQGAA